MNVHVYIAYICVSVFIEISLAMVMAYCWRSVIANSQHIETRTQTQHTLRKLTNI